MNGWPIQVSPLWSCPFHISQFDFWNYHWKFVLYCQTENIKFPLWSHNSVSQAVKYQLQWGRGRYKVWWLVINEEHSMTISGSKLCSAVHFTVSSGLIWDWRVLGRDQNFNHKSIKNIDAEGPKCLVFTSAIYQSLQNAIEESRLMYSEAIFFSSTV